MGYGYEIKRLRDVANEAAGYRVAAKAGKAGGLPQHEVDRLLGKDRRASARMYEGYDRDSLMALAEILGKHVPPGHDDNNVLFALRSGYRRDWER